MKIFVSYKHGKEYQNAWVKKLVTDLIEIYGIDCSLDQYDLLPGDSIYQYMQKIKTETGIVLFIITPNAIKSIEDNTGGISFEAQLWSALRDEGKLRVIPILKEGDQTAAYVAAHLYIDFRNEAIYSNKLKELADTIQDKNYKPKLNVRNFEKFNLLSPKEKVEFMENLIPNDTKSISILARALNDKSPHVAGNALSLLAKKHQKNGLEILKDYKFPGMIYIPDGDFIMGEGEECHTVTLNDYYIDKYPVTNKDYSLFIQDTNHIPPHYWINGEIPKGYENHPVVYVSWYDAVAYAHWTGKRLPTEAEWEKAALWDNIEKKKRKFPWGDVWKSDLCNNRESGVGDTMEIGYFSPLGDSAYGVSEMYGNIREWTSSKYRPYPYNPKLENNRFSPEEGIVVRGKSWDRLRNIGRSKISPVPGQMPVSFYRFRCVFSFRK